MKRRDPPPLAIWMLEHLMPADCDEALAGDLLEVFRTGRSEAWFWRQAMAALVVSWTNVLRAHLPLLAFALVWSMLAPAWKVSSDHVRASLMNNVLWRGPGPLPVLADAVLWLTLNAIFLWSAILLYSLSHRRFSRPITKKKLGRAVLLAPLIFLPSVAVTAILMLLYSYPGLTNARLAATPLGRIVDLGIPADVLRIPYCVSIVAALWGAIPRFSRAGEQEIGDEAPVEYPASADSGALVSTLDSFAAGRFFGLMVAAGLVNAMIAGFALCRLPDPRAMDLGALFARAASFVLIGALAGVGGSWFYWSGPASPFRDSAPVPFWRFGLACASGWVWVPSMLVFREQISAASAFVAMIGSYALATGLRQATGPVFAPAGPPTARADLNEGELFAESLQKPPFEIHGYLIAFCLYAAGLALAHGWHYTGAALLASSAFVFAWRRTVPQARTDVRQDILRLALASMLAILVTMWALLDGYAHRNQAVDAANGNTPVRQSWKQATAQHLSRGAGGFESIILWPFPEKKQMIQPPPPRDSLLEPGTKRPIVIRFTGPYWFTQPPDRRPGAQAHQAHGTPASVDILSSNALPLLMNAHQYLSSSLRLALCREIDVQIENRDNLAGEVSLGLFLEDNSTPGKPSLYVGQQPIVSTLPGQFAQKSAPQHEVLRYMIPETAKIRRFDEISILFLPDIEHRYIAPKIAIEQFQLFPR